VTCANCTAPSDYLIEDPGVNPIELCTLHMPWHLMPRMIAGHFKLIQR
jgi:hypothetical protein